jgi:hypothetical protein
LDHDDSDDLRKLDPHNATTNDRPFSIDLSIIRSGDDYTIT